MRDAIRQAITARYQSWLYRRIPPTRSVTLDQRRIFIFPTKVGGSFLALLLLMLIAAINYQNNMSFALVFFLASVFVVTILHTFANLSGLTVTAVAAPPVFAGEQAEFELSLSRHGSKDYYDIELFWPASERSSITLTDNTEQRLRLHLATEHRGLLRPERLHLESYYPLGIIRAWTLLALDIEALVYPRPLACELAGVSAEAGEEGAVSAAVGSDDFYQFKAYQPGDPLKHVVWKAYAKGQPLQTKQFAAYQEQRLWLDWQFFSGDTEQRLSNICYWVLKLHERGDDYGLVIPGTRIAVQHGQLHRDTVLRALALYQIDSAPSDQGPLDQASSNQRTLNQSDVTGTPQ